MNCHSCHTHIKLVDGRTGRRDSCDKCGADLHCCKNCEFYDVNSYNECREVQADRVVDKEKSNFCDYFNFGSKSALSEADEAKRKLEELFKK